MGNATSKNKGTFSSRGKIKNVGSKANSASDDQINEYEDQELRLLRRTIQKDPDSFILNNLMMCVQFFENYEEDIIQVKETLTSSCETKLNKKLPPQKHVLLPDVLQKHVAHNVGFTSMRQTSRSTVEPLQPVRIYVVHDNIEITEQNYPPEYSSVNNAITYSLLVKPSEHEGYVHLQLLDETPFFQDPNKKEDIRSSSITEDDDEIYSDSESVYGPRPVSKILLSRQMKDSLQKSEILNKTSLCNLHNDVIYEDQTSITRQDIDGTRSKHDIKDESDYEHPSSTEERKGYDKRIQSKTESTVKRVNHKLKQVKPKSKKSKNHWTNGRSPTSSTSSGYQSGSYAVDSDSDCSCHTVNVTSDCNHDSTTTTTTTTTTSTDADEYTDKTAVNTSTEIYSMLNAKIPRQCFKKVIHTREGRIYDARVERKQPQNSKQRRLRMAMRQRNYDVFYTSSIEFMQHFANLFIDQLAEPLGFDREDLIDLKPEGSVIYCDKVILSYNSRYHTVESYEITPTIWLQWPECAQEWLDRSRNTWPDYHDVDKVKDFGCYVIPESFTPKRGSNLYQEIEWQLTFPAAERYLETCMTHSQAQVYLIALMLHKTFIRPVFDTMYGLTTSHIRNKIFWLIEEDDRPSRWPDNRTGECLIKLLSSLYHGISQNEPTLSDYFIRGKNVFQRVPSDHLLHTQKQLKRIIENPIMYVFHAMENIRHSEKFFPRLNYEMLFKLLTADTLDLISPTLDQRMFKSSNVKMNEGSHVVKEDIYNKEGGFWDNAKMKTDNQRKTYNTRVLTNKTLINPRKATDSIIEIPIRCAKLEGPRLGALLDFFIRHFIKMAERCHQYRSYQQKQIYLDQADRLSIILSEMTRHKDDAKAYQDKICALRKRLTKLQDEPPPETPKRNLEAPLFSAALKDRFIQGTSTDIATESEDEVQSSHKNHVQKFTVASVHEVRFNDNENVQVTSMEVTMNDEGASTSRESLLQDQKNESVSRVIPEVISIADNQKESSLTEAV